jgi:hypothetical protein
MINDIISIIPLNLCKATKQKVVTDEISLWQSHAMQEEIGAKNM